MSLQENARIVLDILERGSFLVDGTEVSIGDQQTRAEERSRLYTPEELQGLRLGSSQDETLLPKIEVIDGTTQTVAKSLAEEGPVVLLNFASARNPGGGFIKGAKAQEEDLCRCSGLYNTLITHQESYYETNRRHSCLLYTDHSIYSPDVPFFKTRGTGDLLSKPFLASVITAPAPNTGPYLDKQSGDPKRLAECFERRWQNVLAIARDQNHDTLLLGAWGCGAFRGDPLMASETAKTAIQKMGSGLRRVVFAIPGKGKQSRHNLQVFREQFSN